MIQSASLSETRFCSTCGQERPSTEFRRRKAINDFASHLNETGCGARCVANLCRTMLRRFGGLEAFATEWKRQIDAAAAARPGSATVLRNLQAVTRLIEISDRQARTAPHPKKPDVRGMSDEALRREWRELIKQARNAKSG